MEKWYLVKPELNKVQQLLKFLETRNIPYLFPANCMNTRSGRVLIPPANSQFGNFIFVKADQGQFQQLGKSTLVKNFLYWLNVPVVVPEIYVREMNTVFSAYTYVIIEPIAINISQHAANVNSYGNNWQEAGDSVILELPVIGYRMVVNAKEHFKIQKASPFAEMQMDYRKLQLASLPI